MNKPLSILAQLQDILIFNSDKASFDKIAHQVKRLGQSDRLRLISLCKYFFDDSRARMHQPTRVAISKVCISLLPDSQHLIQRWLRTTSGKGVHDVHFSLFVFSYEIQNFDHLKRFQSPFLKLMESYLMHGKRETSQAVWMAGESLGDDWGIAESLPILLRIVRHAPHTVARGSALHGLSHAITRASKRDAKLIGNALEHVANEDPAKEIRQTARFIVKGS